MVTLLSDSGLPLTCATTWRLAVEVGSEVVEMDELIILCNGRRACATLPAPDRSDGISPSSSLPKLMITKFPSSAISTYRVMTRSAMPRLLCPDGLGSSCRRSRRQQRSQSLARLGLHLLCEKRSGGTLGSCPPSTSRCRLRRRVAGTRVVPLSQVDTCRGPCASDHAGSPPGSYISGGCPGRTLPPCQQPPVSRPLP
jgi:hypothetical protein